MQSLAAWVIVFVVTACSGDRSARTAEPKQEPACRTAADCGAGEICRGPDGCEMAATCQTMVDLTCGGSQTTMCGCDGATFQGDQSCPGRPVFRHAACDAPAVCNKYSSGPNCDAPEAPCPAGRVREWVNGCWEACVAIALCGCATDKDCPAAAPRCDAASARCTP